ncbi:hypothetical protein QOZ98_001591 [Planomicrobium stackebrandtii]|uniref:Uncharacterized protein n=1 Tax=Planomicrobium stackebrandtii TaxID=253160 RepID=A0ABU0GTS5_9BACL|nr:hypothetical protein [Planomicrobium stackebrandtii]MDQ0428765.1 hypothetical protein [Planomicrobium stackebrandtii]
MNTSAAICGAFFVAKWWQDRILVGMDRNLAVADCISGAMNRIYPTMDRIALTTERIPKIAEK